MILLPAVDIRGGKCVRLTRGDYKKETVYFDDPVEAAKKWVGLGAKWLHVVDLDGALEGRRVNDAIVARIIEETGAQVQIGGGIRDEAAARDYIEMGAARVVIGTRALEDPKAVGRWCQKFPGKIAVSLDVKEGCVAIKGWTQTTDRKAADVADELEKIGVSCLIYTDTGRDGLLQGINGTSVRAFVRSTSLPVIVAGGVTSLADIEACRNAGAHGVILGKALYEGKLDLKKALEASS